MKNAFCEKKKCEERKEKEEQTLRKKRENIYFLHLLFFPFFIMCIKSEYRREEKSEHWKWK
jgi:hypothetical protein